MRVNWRIALISLTLISLILLGSLSILSSGTTIPAQAYEIKDLSGIQIPDYTSAGLFPIEQTIQEILVHTQDEVADTPKNPQHLLLKWSDYIRYIDTGMSLPDRQLDDLVYLVTVDVIRRPWEGPRRFAPLVWEKIEKGDLDTIEHFTTHQDTYVIDARTGETLGFGYTPFAMILPKK